MEPLSGDRQTHSYFARKSRHVISGNKKRAVVGCYLLHRPFAKGLESPFVDAASRFPVGKVVEAFASQAIQQ